MIYMHLHNAKNSMFEWTLISYMQYAHILVTQQNVV